MQSLADLSGQGLPPVDEDTGRRPMGNRSDEPHRHPSERGGGRLLGGGARAARGPEAAQHAGPGPVSLGPLIHNPTVIAQLAGEGVGVIDDACGEMPAR